MSRLRSNIFSVGVLQIVIYVANFAALPYLTRILGVNLFGYYALIVAISQYAVVVTNWGFWGNTVRKISKDRINNEYVSGLFWATWFAQWLIFVALFFIAFCFMLILNCYGIKIDVHLFFAGVLIVAGSVLTPSWFLQGYELFNVLSVSQIVPRLTALPLYYVFVKSPSDLSSALMITAFVGWASGIYCLYWIFSRNLVRLRIVNFSSVLEEIRDGAELVLSQIWIAFYVTLIPVFLGYISGPAEVGIFNLADKFKTAGTSLMTPISQALFPRMTELIHTDKRAAYKLFKRSSCVLIAISLIGGVAMYLLSDWIVYIFGGASYQASSGLLKMMAPLPFLIIIASIITTQVVLPLGDKKIYTKIYCISGLASLIFMWPLMSEFGAVGAVLTMGIVESLVTISMVIYLFHSGRKAFN